MTALELVNKLRDVLVAEAMSKLPPCSFCNGTGQVGIPTYMTPCSVCRGTKVDQAALFELNPNGYPR